MHVREKKEKRKKKERGKSRAAVIVPAHVARYVEQSQRCHEADHGAVARGSQNGGNEGERNDTEERWY